MESLPDKGDLGGCIKINNLTLMNNFWKKLKRPIFCLAPMADVTDCAFRRIVAKYSRHGGVGGPDIFWTEFVSADGLAHPKAQKKLLIDLKFSKKEHPIVAQLFGSNVENMKKASALCKKLGFDGIDINMGCPDKSVEKQNSGAAMIKNPKLAREIIRAAREGANGLPISVKTRIGYGKNEIETWIRKLLLEEDLSALTVHLRTRKEMSGVSAHWELMKRIVKIRDEIKSKTLIIGNGDVGDIEEAKQKIKETGCDGVMFGRAIFGNPWLFSRRKKQDLKSLKSSCFKERLSVLIEHAKLFEKMLGKTKSFNIMKKHFKAYVNDFPGAKELRTKLMDTKNAREVEKIIKDFLKNIKN
ncbi:MAG: tRNA-dihydrouridine synthase [Parcubacteria group bacterium GW2011_GWF2_38_8]|nr:MAG: tRNA-dihydrouridine synthase [Parcubacteria group bacterium GW2011_GWF2_38_8]